MTTEKYKCYEINTLKSDLSRSKYLFTLHKEDNGKLFYYEHSDSSFKRVRDAHEAAKKLIDESEDKIEWGEVE